MFHHKNKNISIVSLTVDLVLLLVSFFIAKQYVFDWEIPNNLLYNSLIVGWLILWAIIGLKGGLYDVPRIIQMHKVLAKNIKYILFFAFVSTGLIFMGTSYKFSRLFVLVTMLSFVLGIVIWRMILMYWLKHTRRNGNKTSKIVIIGMNQNVTTLINTIYKNPSFGFSVLGIFTDASITEEIQDYYKGKLTEIICFLNKNKVDEIVISLPYSQSKLINDLFKFADNNMIRVRIIPEFSEYLSQVFTIDYVQNVPVMKLRKEPLQSLSNRVIKRVFDIVFSSLAVLLLFSWLFPIIAIIIKATSKGPVFFSQLRTGKDGVSFKCFKFRSMVVNDVSDNKQATKDDKRITKFGAFMRKTSIDELPQIINVLLNNMSLVGPRPHMLKHTEEYRLLVDKFMVRHFAKPGVTGWAQINGFRGETKFVRDMANRAEADIWYIENWSFILDIKIICITAWSMFFKQDENAF
ncbi:undecaprenyl-phosphate glucose phosphotransferase [Wenyingzhuangia aestuarii]|uniref:undecaprenyl-phosphate glucose phosphotransferase n=1 Tax=Wenyingzhuangia aestuarii TaxID=1647582 RepID=UPI00143B5EC6|nr:undecaprenyl-phosphate glucose phosphotransferase [Wenyingzhuangia aestuarii]NJB83249.1 undecaprenyl-phosphate galactose phosphotransferase/putative colanic acid biosynthesis UDP-glucose lipid carrier transferase [Wenyingzhuangia aestuarii]